MAEICGYGHDSVAFWHKYGRLSEKKRLVSTDLEANLVSKNIPEDRVIKVCFEHLDSYIGMDVMKIFNEGQNSNGSSGHQQCARCTNKEEGLNILQVVMILKTRIMICKMNMIS